MSPQLPFKDKGPCEVVWDYGGGGGAFNLSPFLGTISFRTTDSVSDVQEEAYGETPVDTVFTGTVVELDIPMARSETSRMIALLEGVALGAGGITVFSVKAGCDMYANAKQMVIKPMCDGAPSTTAAEWILLYKCHPYREFDLGFDRDGQRIHMVKFKVFVNLDSGYQGKLYQYGVV